MKFKKLDSMDTSGEVFRKNELGCINPFHQDAYHMGIQIGTNVTILTPNFDKEACKYFIIVDTKTGQQVRVTFQEN